jgi:hypothetical protein
VSLNDGIFAASFGEKRDEATTLPTSMLSAQPKTGIVNIRSAHLANGRCGKSTGFSQANSDTTTPQESRSFKEERSGRAKASIDTATHLEGRPFKEEQSG